MMQRNKNKLFQFASALNIILWVIGLIFIVASLIYIPQLSVQINAIVDNLDQTMQKGQNSLTLMDASVMQLKFYIDSIQISIEAVSSGAAEKSALPGVLQSTFNQVMSPANSIIALESLNLSKNLAIIQSVSETLNLLPLIDISPLDQEKTSDLNETLVLLDEQFQTLSSINDRIRTFDENKINELRAILFQLETSVNQAHKQIEYLSADLNDIALHLENIQDRLPIFFIFPYFFLIAIGLWMLLSQIVIFYIIRTQNYQ